MLYLYLDESGDLGFDFVNKKPSAFFTVCVLAIKGQEEDRLVANAVRQVLGRKLHRGSHKGAVELKGKDTSPEVKRYFFNKVKEAGFTLHAATLNKRRLYDSLERDKDRIYNYVARMALENVDFKDAAVRVIMTVDKSKSRWEIVEFNSYMLSQLKGAIDPRVPLDIVHIPSQESCGLQAADMFTWGVFRKYERGDCEWYGVFQEKVRSDCLFLP